MVHRATKLIWPKGVPASRSNNVPKWHVVRLSLSHRVCVHDLVLYSVVLKSREPTKSKVSSLRAAVGGPSAFGYRSVLLFGTREECVKDIYNIRTHCVEGQSKPPQKVSISVIVS